MKEKIVLIPDQCLKDCIKRKGFDGITQNAHSLKKII
jgi:hypothetical protein